MRREGRKFRVHDTYAGCERLYAAWIEGARTNRNQFFAIVGRPGTGKSFFYETRLDNCIVLNAGLSPFGLYERLLDERGRGEEHRNKVIMTPIVLDDVEHGVGKAQFRDLVKQIASRQGERIIRWNTNAVKDPADREVIINSPVLLLLNWVPNGNPNIEAMLDRFDVIEFAPTKVEVLARIRTFAKDPRDVELFAALDILPSLRLFKRFQDDWKPTLKVDLAIQELERECLALDDGKVSQHAIMLKELILQNPNCTEREIRAKYMAAAARRGDSSEAAKKQYSRNKDAAYQLVAARKAYGLLKDQK